MKESTPCISCDFHDKHKRQFYIDENQKVWPCCHYANEHNLKELDNKLYESLQDNPDWNNISKHDMKEIVDNPLYSHDIYIPGWETNPSKLCVKICGRGGPIYKVIPNRST